VSKPLEWVGSSYKDLNALPEAVQDTFGYALDLAQRGLKHDDAKPFTQGGGDVMESVEDVALIELCLKAAKDHSQQVMAKRTSRKS
jgi:phage-related protein